MNRLDASRARRVRRCVGLLSGTSADAVEAALCRIEGTGADVRLSLELHHSAPFDRALSRQIIEVQTVAEACALNFLLGEKLAEAALALLARAGVRPEDVDVIGSHGQTIAHLPPPLFPVPSTLQIGEASVIAERTGIPVVFDFRSRDMAAGGQGAPLVPYLDWAVFRKPGTHRVLLNLGGIANFSLVGDRLEETVALDTGPGNMILDALAARATSGAEAMDRDGALSARGQVIPELLAELLAHPFLALPAPRSAGRESFGAALVDRIWARHPARPFDLLATAVSFTVESVALALERFAFPVARPEGIYVSGGGARNPRLLEALARRLSPLPVQRLDALGFPEGAKEAACFALLASEHLSGQPGNVPRATGARAPVVLGKMVP